MRKVWAVIRREFLERVRTRAFLIGTFLGPAFIAAMMVLPAMLMRQSSTKRIVVLDAAEGGFGVRVADALRRATFGDDSAGPPRYMVTRVPAEGRLEEKRDSLIAITDRRDLGDARLDGLLVVTENALASDSLEYLGGNAGSVAEMGYLQRTLRQVALTEKLARSGIDPALLAQTMRPLTVVTAKVNRGQLTGQSGESTFLLAYVMAFVLYIALLLYGVQVMTSTVEEKTNRINEVLVSSLRPYELLLGKVVGVGSVGLLQLSIWGGTAWLLASNRTRIASMLGADTAQAATLPIPAISGGVIIVLLIFFVLGFFFYSAAYAAVGSTCNTVQETQQAQMPITLLVVLGLISIFRLLDDPNSSFARVMSLVPPVAPFVTPVRNSLSPLPFGELLLSIGAMILGVLAMAWVAGRIYRTGILMYGKRATLREVFRWIRAG